MNVNSTSLPLHLLLMVMRITRPAKPSGFDAVCMPCQVCMFCPVQADYPCSFPLQRLHCVDAVNVNLGPTILVYNHTLLTALTFLI